MAVSSRGSAITGFVGELTGGWISAAAAVSRCSIPADGREADASVPDRRAATHSGTSDPGEARGSIRRADARASAIARASGVEARPGRDAAAILLLEQVGDATSVAQA